MRPPNDKSRDPSRSFGWFVAIGGLAGSTHYVVTLATYAGLAMSPTVANAIGFLCAFPVSYLGHRHLSFAGTTRPHRSALPRLFVVACLGFAVNQALLMFLLTYSMMPLWLALAIVLAAVAVATYLLSRTWAFAATRPPDTRP